MGIARGDRGTVGKEVRWLQAKQVPLRPLAINGHNHCFASRTCDTLAGQKDARQRDQMNEVWQARTWGWKSGASGQKMGNKSGPVWMQNIANRIAVHSIFLPNLVFIVI